VSETPNVFRVSKFLVGVFVRVVVMGSIFPRVVHCLSLSLEVRVRRNFELLSGAFMCFLALNELKTAPQGEAVYGSVQKFLKSSSFA